MLEIYGPMLGGQKLLAVLGYQSPSAFHKARRAGLLGVKLFQVPGRRGHFCMTLDIAQWMLSLSRRDGPKVATGEAP